MQHGRLDLRLVWENWFGPKRPDQADLSERYGRVERGLSNHPYTKETGLKGASNVGSDDVAGSEYLEPF